MAFTRPNITSYQVLESLPPPNWIQSVSIDCVAKTEVTRQANGGERRQSVTGLLRFATRYESTVSTEHAKRLLATINSAIDVPLWPLGYAGIVSVDWASSLKATATSIVNASIAQPDSISAVGAPLPGETRRVAPAIPGVLKKITAKRLTGDLARATIAAEALEPHEINIQPGYLDILEIDELDTDPAANRGGYAVIDLAPNWSTKPTLAADNTAREFKSESLVTIQDPVEIELSRSFKLSYLCTAKQALKLFQAFQFCQGRYRPLWVYDGTDYQFCRFGSDTLTISYTSDDVATISAGFVLLPERSAQDVEETT